MCSWWALNPWKEGGQQVDLKKLTPGEITTAVSGVVLLIVSFFTWYSVDVLNITVANRGGWSGPAASGRSSRFSSESSWPRM
jgi:hypothetical protein